MGLNNIRSARDGWVQPSSCMPRTFLPSPCQILQQAGRVTPVEAVCGCELHRSASAHSATARLLCSAQWPRGLAGVSGNAGRPMTAGVERWGAWHS